MADVRALGIDCYGTMVTWPGYPYNPVKELVKDLGFTGRRFITAWNTISTKPLASWNDGSLQDVVQTLKPGEEFDTTQYERQLEELLKSVRLYSDVVPVLGELRERRMRLALISNVSTPFIEPYESLGLDRFFDTAIFSCDARYRKSNSQIYMIGLERINQVIERENKGYKAQTPLIVGTPEVLLLPDHDTKLRVKKPERPITVDQMIMVGDSVDADLLGPRSIGMPSLLLDRDGVSERRNTLPDLYGILDHVINGNVAEKPAYVPKSTAPYISSK